MEKNEKVEVANIMLEREMVIALLDRLEAVQLFLQYATSACPEAKEFPDLLGLLEPVTEFFTSLQNGDNWQSFSPEELKAEGIVRHEIGTWPGTGGGADTPTGRA
ncbi:MAG: hypothetical protein Q8M54_00420 [Desulfobaccales bacterium]|nr:hypothetical protein [Desulfobaccales bacterium]